jgi:hypothetical protein
VEQNGEGRRSGGLVGASVVIGVWGVVEREKGRKGERESNTGGAERGRKREKKKRERKRRRGGLIE